MVVAAAHPVDAGDINGPNANEPTTLGVSPMITGGKGSSLWVSQDRSGAQMKPRKDGLFINHPNFYNEHPKRTPG